jgi:hypothetical protein
MAGSGYCAVAAELPHEADFYVSAKGSDEWSGTLASPAAGETDGPFATLARARDAVRELKKQKATDIVVLVRKGTYRLKSTVVFGLEDSGEGDSTITYAAYPGETPAFSSGREIKGLRKVSVKLPGLPTAAQGNVWVANVSDRFFTLYDAEGLLPRARSAGFIPLSGGSRNTLHFPEGRLKNWPNVEDVEILVRPHHAWIMNVLPLASVDERAQIARTAVDATYAMNRLHFLKDTESCWVENVLEELDEPGEWVLNTKEGKLYLWPRSESPVFAPTLLELIRVEGAIDKEGPKDTPVRNLRFRGLTFMHGDRYLLNEDDAGLQHDWDMLDKANALVRLRGTEKCIIEQCHFFHSGSGAVRVDLHGQQNEISGNLIEHMGGAGSGNVIRRNYVHHLVNPMKMQAAIRTDGGQRDTLIAENLIYKCMAQGIILKLDNRCENNIVADIIAPPRGYYLSLREGPLTGATIKRNIFYSVRNETVFIDELPPGKGRKTEDSRGRSLARAKDADTDYNIYYCAADPALGRTMLAKQQGVGVDAHSLSVDPLFVDPENGDFRLRPNSPALEMGFVPFDESKVGLRFDKQ